MRPRLGGNTAIMPHQKSSEVEDAALCMRLMIALGAIGCALTHTVPTHLRNGFIGELLTSEEAASGPIAPAAATLHVLDVPLDHFDDKNTKTMQVRYYAYEASWDKAGPLFVEMPGEGSVSGCGAPSLVRAFNGLILCPEHRFFGTTSVPGNSSSTANLRFLSVEQNLADVKAIVGDAKRVYSTSVPVVAIGGSYSGASAAWARMTYPETFSSAISESGPVEATLDYFAYESAKTAKKER